ncbi:MAG: hypothetical protein H6621_01650 [Halobacteriovoraceae bacterium]|nr:hypothetical protein [Halobacteriovoraceae bacterium]
MMKYILLTFLCTSCFASTPLFKRTQSTGFTTEDRSHTESCIVYNDKIEKQIRLTYTGMTKIKSYQVSIGDLAKVQSFIDSASKEKAVKKIPSPVDVPSSKHVAFDQKANEVLLKEVNGGSGYILENTGVMATSLVTQIDSLCDL